MDILIIKVFCSMWFRRRKSLCTNVSDSRSIVKKQCSYLVL